MVHAFNLVRVRSALTTHLHGQLPRVLQDRLVIDVECDAFMLRAKARFKDGHDVNARRWETELEQDVLDDVEIPCKIPEVFLSQLCLMVV